MGNIFGVEFSMARRRVQTAHNTFGVVLLGKGDITALSDTVVSKHFAGWSLLAALAVSMDERSTCPAYCVFRMRGVGGGRKIQGRPLRLCTGDGPCFHIYVSRGFMPGLSGVSQPSHQSATKGKTQ